MTTLKSYVNATTKVRSLSLFLDSTVLMVDYKVEAHRAATI